jgi:hypothetical protein
MRQLAYPKSRRTALGESLSLFQTDVDEHQGNLVGSSCRAVLPIRRMKVDWIHNRQAFWSVPAPEGLHYS